mmetsp:Transcript_7632/g.17038  ORF Transcript_7632/g.17038 Transcript_7632/m.17038 type:complete len:251 (+) Transcript_7632:1237-1989(+)
MSPWRDHHRRLFSTVHQSDKNTRYPRMSLTSQLPHKVAVGTQGSHRTQNCQVQEIFQSIPSNSILPKERKDVGRTSLFHYGRNFLRKDGRRNLVEHYDPHQMNQPYRHCLRQNNHKWDLVAIAATSAKRCPVLTGDMSAPTNHSHHPDHHRCCRHKPPSTQQEATQGYEKRHLLMLPASLIPSTIRHTLRLWHHPSIGSKPLPSQTNHKKPQGQSYPIFASFPLRLISSPPAPIILEGLFWSCPAWLVVT